MLKKSSTSNLVDGSLHVANKAGFAEMLSEANAKRANGYKLISVVPMGGMIGAVYVRERSVASSAFFSEAPEEDAEIW